MENKKQTAVEFLIKEFSDILGPLDTKPMQDLLIMDAMKKAKEMEKSQIVDAYKNGKWECDKIVMSDKFYGKQYYEEVYGDNK